MHTVLGQVDAEQHVRETWNSAHFYTQHVFIHSAYASLNNHIRFFSYSESTCILKNTFAK